MELILQLLIGFLFFLPAALFIPILRFAAGSHGNVSRLLILGTIVILVVQALAVFGLRFLIRMMVPDANHQKIEDLSMLTGVAGPIFVVLIVAASFRR